MSNNVITVSGLHKAYNKGDAALRGLDMSVPQGCVYGFIGQNGSGKSTTLKTIMGLLRPDSGSVSVLGDEGRELAVTTKRRIAYVPETTFYFSWFSIKQMMDYVSRFYPLWSDRHAMEMLETLNLAPGKKMSSLSMGQTRAVSLIIAISCNPDLLILDEPAGNLDVMVRRQFHQQILDFALQEGKSVLISSHILTDLERLVDRVGIIHQGKILLEEDLDSLKDRLVHLRLVYECTPPEAFDIPNIISQNRSENEVLLTIRDLDESNLSMFQSIKNARTEIQRLNLEDLFVACVESTKNPVGFAR